MDTTSKTDVLVIKLIIFNTFYCLMLTCRKHICLELELKSKPSKKVRTKNEFIRFHKILLVESISFSSFQLCFMSF